MTKIELFMQDWDQLAAEGFLHRREELGWALPKEKALEFRLKKEMSPEQAAEYAFELTNAPHECLKEGQVAFLKRVGFQGPSLSVGDVVRVSYPLLPDSTPIRLLCKGIGWERE